MVAWQRASAASLPPFAIPAFVNSNAISTSRATLLAVSTERKVRDAPVSNFRRPDVEHGAAALPESPALLEVTQHGLPLTVSEERLREPHVWPERIQLW